MTAGDFDRAAALPPEANGAALLDLPEDQWFERKSAKVSAKDLAIPMVAMANAEGGVIVVGLHDGRVEDVPVPRRNELSQAALDFTQPPIRATISEILTQDHTGTAATIMLFRVEPGDHLHLTKRGDCYLRVGDESRRLSPAQQRELAFDRGYTHYEATWVPLTAADLDQPQLMAYTEAIGASSVEAMLAARDLVDRQGRITIAAQLLFDDRPQREFPNALVRVLRYRSAERGLGSSMSLESGTDIRVEGSIPQQIAKAKNTIAELVPKHQRLDSSGIFSSQSIIPQDAWLEGLVNAVVHRSYSMMGDHIRVEIFPNRIEITSPGRFPGMIDPKNPHTLRRYARNPRIARVCADLGITRELGEGIRRIFAEMRSHGLADPIYQQSSSTVTLTLLATGALSSSAREQLTPSALKVLDAMRAAARPLGTGQLAELAGVTRITAARALATLRDEGLAVRRGTSPNDPRATWQLAAPPAS